MWRYDPRSILYRHGGAGNNWALGYSMASGEFLEKSLDCIRRELENCDSEAGLIFLHSLAGGTGSGLGTHITEACEDEFPSSFRSNIVIAPHHFGEVVVQHYNALLCLSKIHQASQGIVLFENEIAQMLCKEMHGIEKPLLTDLNNVISSNLLALFLPKVIPSDSSDIPPTGTIRTAEKQSQGCHHRPFVKRHFFDDLTFLCSHPGYHFCQIRLTPQTSKKSIDYTYDSWMALLKAIQRMQLSGTLLERHIRFDIKSLLTRRDQIFEDSGTFCSATSMSSKRTTPPPHDALADGVTRSLASIITFHGEKAYQASSKLNENQSNQTPPHQNRDSSSFAAHSKLTTRTIGSASSNDHNNLQLYEEFRESHADIYPVVGMKPIQIQASPFLVNKYKRSTTVLSNDQTILPILQRTILKSQDMFEVGAYVHQYTSNSLEHGDFYDAFQSIGATVHNYSNL
jgi:hypothetical protein